MTASTSATTSFLDTLKADLAADWQEVVTFWQQATQNLGTILSKVSAGEQVLIEDLMAIGTWINGNLGIITATTSALETAAAKVAPGNADVQNAIAAIQSGAQEVAAVSSTLTSGSASDDATVTKAVTAITAVNQLAVLSAQLGSTISQLTAASPTATQAVSPPTPPQA